MRQRKLHYKMYKDGKKWVFAGIITVTLGLGVAETKLNAQADNINGVTSSSIADSAAQADTASTTSDSATQADTASTTSNSATQANTASTTSNSATQANTASTTSNSATQADTTSTTSNSATTSSNSGVVALASETDTMPSVNLKTSLNGTKSQNDSVSFSYSIETTREKVVHKGDTIRLNISSAGLDYSTLQLSDGSNYFALSYNSEGNFITLTATQDILYEGTIGVTVVGNPTKNDSNTDKTGTYDVTSSYNSSLGETEEISGDYMTLSVNNGDNFVGTFSPNIVGVKDSDYAASVGYNDNYSGANDGNAMYVYNQNAMIVAGYLWNYTGSYSNLVWTVRTPGYQIDQQSLKAYLGSEDKTSSVVVTWDSDGEGFSVQLPGTYTPWGLQWGLRFVVKTTSNSDIVKGVTSVTGIDTSTGSAIVGDSSKHNYLNNSETFEYYPTSNGKFAPYISASDKTIYDTQKLTNDDLLKLVNATDQDDGNISNKVTISNYGGFNVGTTNPVGNYTITYSVTNSSGNTSTATATITVLNDQAAIDTKDSTLVAGPNTTWSAADNFVDAKATDGSALNLSDLTVSGSVDTTKPGSYEVTYSYTDAAGNEVTKTATITVVASQAAIDTKDSTLVAGPNTTWSAADNFVDAKAADGSALNLSDLTVSGSVDTTKPGSYEVTYSYTDAAGNEISKTATITVVASQAVIDTKDSTLLAGPNTTWSAADNFVDAKAADGNALKLSDLTVSGSVDTTKPGSYEVTYSYTDAAGNKISKTATITVVASQAVIDTKDSTLLAGPNTTWSAADNFVDAKAADGNALKLSDLTVSGSVDTTKPGSYEVTYSYTDAAGNKISKTATITVVASQAVIDTKDSTLVAGPDTAWSAADNFVDAKAADGSALNLSDLTVSGSVDTTKPGSYEVTYSYTDAAGNEVTKTATITVVASQAAINANNSTINQDTTWSAADNFVDAKAADGSALNLSDLTISGSVDTTKPGSYEVTYSYTDIAGNVITKKIIVTVKASDNSGSNNHTSGQNSNNNGKNDVNNTESDVANTKIKANSLPQTGEEKNSGMSVYGAILITLTSIGSLIGLGRKKRNR